MCGEKSVKQSLLEEFVKPSGIFVVRRQINHPWSWLKKTIQEKKKKKKTNKQHKFVRSCVEISEETCCLDKILKMNLFHVWNKEEKESWNKEKNYARPKVLWGEHFICEKKLKQHFLGQKC